MNPTEPSHEPQQNGPRWRPGSAHDPFGAADARDPFDGRETSTAYAPITSAPSPASPDLQSLSVPEANQRRWSGKKTAVVAAMAIGLASAGAAGASASVPLGSQIGGGGDSRQMGPGGRGQGFGQGFGPSFRQGFDPNGEGSRQRWNQSDPNGQTPPSGRQGAPGTQTGGQTGPTSTT